MIEKVLHINIVEAEDLPKMDRFGKVDPFVVVLNGALKEVYRTKTVGRSYSPKWGEQLTVPFGKNPEFTFKIMDNNLFSSASVFGNVEVLAEKLPFGQIVDQWYTIIPIRGQKLKAGRIHLVTQAAPAGSKMFAPVDPNIVMQVNMQMQARNAPVAPQGTVFTVTYQGYPPQGYPGYPPQGYPGYPPQGYPGYPPQGYPGYPPQGYPGYPQMPPGYQNPPQSGAPPGYFQPVPQQPGQYPPMPPMQPAQPR